MTTRRMTSGDALKHRNGLYGFALDFRFMDAATSDERGVPHWSDSACLDGALRSRMKVNFATVSGAVMSPAFLRGTVLSNGTIKTNQEMVRLPVEARKAHFGDYV